MLKPTDPQDNKVIVCTDCQKPFVFTVGEQEFYLSHKLSEPKRCSDCRRLKRQSFVKGGSDNA